MPKVPTWRQHLDRLLENGGEYAGMGGITDLAVDMEVSRQTIYDWKDQRNAPIRANRRKLARLAGDVYG